MDAIQAGTRGLWLLIDLNWDRLLYVATIIVALMIGGSIGSVLTTGF